MTCATEGSGRAAVTAELAAYQNLNNSVHAPHLLDGPARASRRGLELIAARPQHRWNDFSATADLITQETSEEDDDETVADESSPSCTPARAQSRQTLSYSAFLGKALPANV